MNYDPLTTAGAPCWPELATTDQDRAGEFYGALWGWTTESSGPEFGGYANFSLGGRRVAGCMKTMDASQPVVWNTYLWTTDAEVTTKAAAANGGHVIVPAMQVGPLGSMAGVIDPGGAFIGAWQPGEHRGYQVIDEPGTPGWFELHTRDYDATVAFYRDVFGWDTHAVSDVPEFRYTTLGEGANQRAGIMDASAFLPEGAPASWSIYFQVPDTDTALAHIAELGGAMVLPAEDTPYGRLAGATDPTGALFKLLQPPAM